MQSTALALMSCANKLLAENKAKEFNFTYTEEVPIYDVILFCDLGLEPSWVMDQVRFIKAACKWAEIPFYILKSTLYEDYIQDFGKKRVVSIPFWSLDESGKKGKMMRNCTLDYKINMMQNFIRWNILGYKKGERTHPEDLKAQISKVNCTSVDQGKESKIFFRKIARTKNALSIKMIKYGMVSKIT